METSSVRRAANISAGLSDRDLAGRIVAHTGASAQPDLKYFEAGLRRHCGSGFLLLNGTAEHTIE
jgi:hypothetical protein